LRLMHELPAVCKCPYCDAEAGAATCLEDESKVPRPGDLGVCVFCGNFSIYTEAMDLRRPTDAEIAGLTPGERAALERLQWAREEALHMARSPGCSECSPPDPSGKIADVGVGGARTAVVGPHGTAPMDWAGRRPDGEGDPVGGRGTRRRRRTEDRPGRGRGDRAKEDPANPAAGGSAAAIAASSTTSPGCPGA